MRLSGLSPVPRKNWSKTEIWLTMGMPARSRRSAFRACSSCSRSSATTRRWRCSCACSGYRRLDSDPAETYFHNMRVVTFDDGRPGYLDGATVVELDCGSTREY